MNKFKAGDKVRAYYVDGAESKCFVGYISPVSNDYSKIMTTDGLFMVVQDNGLAKFFHPKQCRKLVKKKSKPKFKVGDKVKILNRVSSYIPEYYINQKGIVNYYYDFNNCVNVDIAGEMFSFRECDLELVSYVPKFKVGDFVYLPVQNTMGIIKIIGQLGEYGVAVIGERYLDNKFDVYHERFMKKLNIKVEY
jgi:hypothetical protein